MRDMDGIGSNITTDFSIENVTSDVLKDQNTGPTYRDIVYAQWEWTAFRYLVKYIMLAISVTGAIGNALAIAVLLRKSICTTPCAILLIILAFADELSSTMTTLYVANDYHMKHALNSVFWCKFGGFLSSSAELWSVNILIAVTAERFIAVRYPFKVATICTRRNVSITAGLVTLFSFAYNTPTLIFAIYIPGRNVCGYHPDYTSYNENIGPWVDSVIYSYIPIATLIVLNFGILKAMRSATTTSQQLSTSSQRDASRMKHITAMCVSVSVAFIICLLPIAIERPVHYVMYDRRDPVNYAMFIFYWFLAWAFLTLNHTINFFLYVITGQRFRQELLNMFCFKGCERNERAKAPPTSGSSKSQTVSSAVSQTAI